MQTNFTQDQLADPRIAEANGILRKCVHCGFCTATCPTYVLLGDELDSPRGRIYLIKDMLEEDKPASPQLVKHIDRCLSCLACVTTCPSGVDYMHLVDQARTRIEETYRRPLPDRAIRALIARILPEPGRMRLALALARLGRPAAPLLRLVPVLKPLAAMLSLAPSGGSAKGEAAEPVRSGERRGRVALLTGCVQSVIAPEINAATRRLLARHGIDVVVPQGQGCCGALTHHMGREDDAMARARRNIDAYIAEMDGEGLDAIVINASGCGTTVKDYGHMFSRDPEYAEKAARVSEITRDITEYMSAIGLRGARAPVKARVAYHSACSMQHGQKIRTEPRTLLERAGFDVRDVPEGHLCCGSAGTYNILQPDIADRLKARKVRNIESTRPDLIATGNIGCITQISSGTGVPVLHTVELLDWACGGPRPARLG
ncbi:glycolate oxidase subunit GlcF [Kaustia mangrovi]|uniref:Glycolate oxidase iron-sulfur subunit n=1 Tax=Kaustia mangrovi TaxID=2593653 RepID=A0A7S8C1J1_9HYPH|nr:glycolate oxidase subunit GlcF [Kaustia mangrovi]QPC41587.1 glycolate oxidase subunit GlcF [Kaustia mangrovi]